MARRKKTPTRAPEQHPEVAEHNECEHGPDEHAILPGTENVVTAHGRGVRLPAQLVSLLVPIDSLMPDPANPRKTKDIDHLANLMRRFGYTDPVVANAAGMLEAGHQRLGACIKLGATHIPAVTVDHSEVEGLAYNIAHNKANEVVAGWDTEALGKLLGKLKDEDELDGLGFAGKELDALLGIVDPGNDLSEQALGEMRWGVIVDVSDEMQQIRLIEEMEERGYKCRPQMT